MNTYTEAMESIAKITKVIRDLQDENKRLEHDRDKWKMDERICRGQLSKTLDENKRYKELLEIVVEYDNAMGGIIDWDKMINAIRKALENK